MNMRIEMRKVLSARFACMVPYRFEPFEPL